MLRLVVGMAVCILGHPNKCGEDGKCFIGDATFEGIWNSAAMSVVFSVVVTHCRVSG